MPRNLQACQGCRRAKVRCQGVKPRCAACLRKGVDCIWPETLAAGSYKTIRFANATSATSKAKDRAVVITERTRRRCAAQNVSSSPSSSAAVDANARELPNGQTSGKSQDAGIANVPSQVPPHLKRRLLRIFSQSHHNVELCGCIQLDMLREETVAGEDLFLLQSISALAALYITDVEAVQLSNFKSAREVWKHYQQEAQASARLLSDRASMTTIHANLVLSLAELLTMAGSMAWLHVGLAMRLAQTLRMKREHNARYSPRQREIRRRTFWACLTLDRIVAYSTFRAQSLELSLIDLHLPCSEADLAFGHETPGPMRKDLWTQEPTKGRESLVLAYFVESLAMWSPIAAIYIDRGRRLISQDLDNGHCARYWQADANMRAWLENLPPGMKWSENNVRAHRSLGQLWHFVDQTVLLNVLTLPFPDGSLGVGPQRLSSTQACIEGASKVMSMLHMVDDVAEGIQPSLFAGIAMATTASVLLWVSCCTPHIMLPESLHVGDPEKARSDVDYLLGILDMWADTWPLARGWATSIRLLEEFYQSRYGLERQGLSTFGPKSAAVDAAHGQKLPESAPPSPAPLRDSDGLPDITTIPTGTYYKVRLITGLSFEQPELCRRYLQMREGQPAEAQRDGGSMGTNAEAQEAAFWETNLDMSWMGNSDFLGDSSMFLDPSLFLGNYKVDDY